jgi:hypothetical protein
MSPDYANNALEFLGAAGIAGPMGQVNYDTNNLVYLGDEFSEREITTGEPPGRTYTASPIDPSITVNKDAAYTAFWRLQPGQRQEWDNLVTQFDGKPPTEGRANSVWRTVVGYAGETYSADPNNPMSVMDIMRQQAANAAANRSARGGGGGGVSGYSRVVSFTSKSDAEYLVNETLKNYLGRAASDEEKKTFYQTLRAQEKASPTITTPTTREQGGVNVQGLAQEFARSRPEAAERQATSQYMDWFMEKLMTDPMQGLTSGL